MGAHRLSRRITAWIAGFAILTASLAPSISHALATLSNSGPSWMEICSITGSKPIQASHGRASDSPMHKQNTHFEHCPYCSLHAGSCAVLRSPASTIPVPEAAPLFPSLFYRSPRVLFVWAAPPPRGPPAVLW